MNNSGDRPDHRSELADALSMMETALEQLDSAAAPGHIGAHVDLAIAKLRQHLAEAGKADLPTIDRAVR